MLLNLRGMRPHVVLLLLMVATQLQGKELSGQVQKDSDIQQPDSKPNELEIVQTVQKNTGNLKEQKAELEGEMEGLDNGIASLKDIIDDDQRKMELKNENFNKYEKEVEESDKKVRDLTTRIARMEVSLNNVEEAVEQARDTKHSRKKNLDDAINRYDGTASSLEEFEKKVTSLDSEIDRMASVIKDLAGKDVEPENRRQWLKERQEAKRNYHALMDIKVLHETYSEAERSFESRTADQSMLLPILESKKEDLLKSEDELAQSTLKRAQARLDIKEANDRLDKAKANLISLEEDKQKLQVELDGINGKISANEDLMDSTYKGSTTTKTGEYKTEDESSKLGENSTTPTDAGKAEAKGKSSKFVGSVGFWILIGVFGSAVLLGVVGIAVYFGCRKKKNAEPMRSDRTSDPSIGLENSLRSDLTMSQADSSNVSQAPSQASTASRSEIA